MKIIEKPLSQKSPYRKGRAVWGECDPDGTIRIDSRLKPQHFLDTLIHELLHREIPDLSEECVQETAEIIAKHLWEKNFRRLQN